MHHQLAITQGDLLAHMLRYSEVLLLRATVTELAVHLSGRPALKHHTEAPAPIPADSRGESACCWQGVGGELVNIRVCPCNQLIILLLAA